VSSLGEGQATLVAPPPSEEISAPSGFSEGPAAPPAAHTTPIGHGLLVGEYRIEAKIGAGGMGTVYKAVQPLIGKTVAVKVLSARLAHNPNAIRRFVLEARAVNDISHPNLVDIFSFGQLTDGRYYYVMEYLEGQSLGTLLRSRRRLSREETVPIFLDVLRALEAAHAKGVIHRDLKPDNVFLAPDATGNAIRAKLLDFGLAKLLESEAPPDVDRPVTAAGVAVGTPQYMSPEQCRGAKVDARTDLYAIGVMLYETLTGELPFSGTSTLDIWEAQVRRAPRRPIALAPDAVTPELDELILRLLSKDPAERLQSAGEVYLALSAHARRIRAGLTPGPIPISTLTPLDPGSRSSHAAPAWSVAHAIPSSLRSSDLVPLDSARGLTTPATATPVSSEAHGLRQVLDIDLSIVEPASETQDPSQVSALNIALDPPRGRETASRPVAKDELPTVALPARTSAALPPAEAPARDDERDALPRSRLPYVAAALVAVAVGAALLLLS
jgi:serine/threonine-protein kinase